jgi:hypothetical protein
MKNKRYGISWAHLAAWVIALMFISATLVVAQSDRGTITGTVADSTGAVVPGATVVVTNTGTQAKLTTETTFTGNFTMASVPAGIYEVAVSAPGFSRSVQQGVQVQVALTVRLDVVLKVGATTESVTVTGEAPMLRTENAEQSMNVQGSRINALPINVGASGNIRDPYAFVILSPGVRGDAEGASINGLGGNNFRVLIEGQDGTSGNAVARANETQPSVESIGEFTLQTSNYSAEYGQALSAVFNFTVRSGTNAYHGSGYEYFVNEALNSYTAFSHTRGVSRKHDWGGTIGGPVFIPKVYNGKDKTFFFFSYEGFRYRQLSGNNYQTLPTTAFRNGDFSAVGPGKVLSATLDPLGRQILENTIYDPGTDRMINGNVVRDPFVGNLLPPNRIDPVAKALQKYIPAADKPDQLYQNFRQTVPNVKYQWIPTVKIDQNFSAGSRLSFYWSEQKSDQVSSQDSLPVPITQRRDQFIYAHTTRANYDHSLSPTFLLHLGAGYVRYLNPDSSPPAVLQDFDAVANLGFVGGATKGMPQWNNLGSGSWGGMNMNMGPLNANYYYNDKFTSNASATYVRGNHTYKAGAELKIDIWTDRNSRGATGNLSFSRSQTRMPAISTLSIPLTGGDVGMNYASFLLGLADTASVNAVQDPQWRKKGWGLYIQDTWKATRKLTIDYGLRWDLQGQGHEIFYRYSQFGPTIPNPSAGGLLGGNVYEGYGPGRCNCNFTNAYPYAIGPRLGVAYQLDPKTVLRGGWGISYSSLPGYSYITNNPQLGVGFDQLTWDNPETGMPGILLKNGMQYNLSDLYTPTFSPGVRPSAGQLNAPATRIDPNGGRPSRVNQWNIGFQRQVIPNLLVEASYVANRAIWVTANSLSQLNLVSDQRLAQFGLDRRNAADRSLLAARIDSPLAASRGFNVVPYAGFPTGTSVRQLLRAFPQFNDNLQPMWAPVGNSWYDSLQVKVTKRFSHGLDGTIAYTWGKELALTGYSNDFYNRVNQKQMNGNPQLFTAAFSYRVPRWRQNKWVATLAGDWTLSGILRYNSGGFIGIPGSANNLSNVIFQGTRMNRLPDQPLFLADLGCHCWDPKKVLFYNPGAWQDVPAGEWGYSAAAYSDYRGMRSANEQISLGRLFRMKESMTFEIRAEFFNAFNRINWAGPNSGSPFQTTQRNSAGDITNGFGFINPNNSNSNPRNGQLVARFQF